MKGILALIAVVVIAVGGYYFYSQQGGVNITPEVGGVNDGDALPQGGAPSNAAGTMPEGSVVDTSDPNTVGGDAAVGEMKEFKVTNQGFVFNPKEMNVKKGDRVKITFTNGGGTHDLRIDGYNVGTKVLQGGQSETFEFVADRAGTFEFYCSVGNHRAMGMKGTFTVTE